MPSRRRTCGYCGRRLGDFRYRDTFRVKGDFCSGTCYSKFLENGNQPKVAGLKEDEEETLHEVKQRGYTDYEDRDEKGGKKPPKSK